MRKRHYVFAAGVLTAVGLCWWGLTYGLIASKSHPMFDHFVSVKFQKALYILRDYIDPSFSSLRLYPMPIKSNVKIDVVIPVVEKDIATVSHTIDSVRKLIFHPIGSIYLIAPESKLIRLLAKEKNCIFILEDEVLPFFHEVKKMGGWILQQFLKLNADNFVQEEHFLIVDADTIFIRPQVFLSSKGTYLNNIKLDYTYERKDYTKQALGMAYHYRLDFVCHHMLIKKTWLKEMKDRIAQVHHLDWVNALLRLLKTNPPHKLSEYDLYATYVNFFYPKQQKFVADANLILYRDRLNALPEISAAYAKDYKSISMHDYYTIEQIP